ncbi:MAG: hypothetical protein HRT44_14325, partial [Bdellovibrionales bacterium]|nr:hypothetical protein [Bdellovibrionales bacterium]
MSAAIKQQPLFQNVDLEKILNGLYAFFIQPFVEVFAGYKLKILPFSYCLVSGSLFHLMVLLKLDYWLFKRLEIDFLYPKSGDLRLLYLTILTFSGFWIWGFIQVLLQKKLTQKLTVVFKDAGLQSASGRLPGFIFDVPIDSETRHIRLQKNGVSMDKWKQVEQTLAEDLQIYTDHFVDNRTSGTVDIIYAHEKMTDLYNYEGHQHTLKDEFFIGKARSKVVKTDFKKCAHYLIGGQTDFGKSHFLNQAITTLYLNNKDYSFELIDLKYGAEFGVLFTDLPRINVYDSAFSAVSRLNQIAMKEITERALFLRENKCQNITELHKLDMDKIVAPKGSKLDKKFGRKIIVIDEAFELFLKNSMSDAKSASAARQAVIKIAAQGRSVGVNVLLGTQRPDSKAIDPMIKANLAGRICFPVPNNATSMTILDNGRGSQLPQVKGRAIWKTGG